jgi:hypothetical protein
VRRLQRTIVQADPMSESGNRWRLTRAAGITLISLSFLGTLAVFPFIYGDPATPEDATDPSWFGPVWIALMIVFGLGSVLVCAALIQWLVLRRSGRT